LLTNDNLFDYMNYRIRAVVYDLNQCPTAKQLGKLPRFDAIPFQRPIYFNPSSHFFDAMQAMYPKVKHTYKIASGTKNRPPVIFDALAGDGYVSAIMQNSMRVVPSDPKTYDHPFTKVIKESGEVVVSREAQAGDVLALFWPPNGAHGYGPVATNIVKAFVAQGGEDIVYAGEMEQGNSDDDGRYGASCHCAEGTFFSFLENHCMAIENEEDEPSMVVTRSIAHDSVYFFKARSQQPRMIAEEEDLELIEDTDEEKSDNGPGAAAPSEGVSSQSVESNPQEQEEEGYDPTLFAGLKKATTKVATTAAGYVRLE
jgi:hypothetical protein